MSIIGFDNIPLGEMVTPSLATVGQPLFEMGRQAVSMVIAEDGTKPSTDEITVPFELLLRESVTPLSELPFVG